MVLGFMTLVAASLAAGCSNAASSNAAKAKADEAQAKTPVDIPVYTYEIVNQYPHDTSAFTQGLIIKDGYFYESTGLHGQSTVRRVDIESGEVLKAAKLPDTLYGEGLAARGDDLLWLTWKAGTGFVIKADDLSAYAKFEYDGDGWGLATADTNIYMSDGTSFIRVLDPNTLQERSRFQVTAKGAPVDKLNELEWAEGELLANIWKTDKIAKINPATGAVTGWIDLAGLFTDRNPDYQGEDVLNGIAYDKDRQRLFVTGKLWPHIFEINVTR